MRKDSPSDLRMEMRKSKTGSSLDSPWNYSQYNNLGNLSQNGVSLRILSPEEYINFEYIHINWWFK